MNVKRLSDIAAIIGTACGVFGLYEWYTAATIQAAVPDLSNGFDDKYWCWPLYAAVVFWALACSGYARFRKRSVVAATSWMLTIIVPSVWFIFALRAKLKYDHLVALTPTINFVATSMDEQSKTFLSKMSSDWACKTDETNGPFSELMRVGGVTPSVKNVIQMFNYRMPGFCWRSSRPNLKAALFGMFKQAFCTRFTDRTFHVSNDGHLALLWNSKVVVFVFQDEPNGLREALYFSKQASAETNRTTNREEGVLSPLQRPGS